MGDGGPCGCFQRFRYRDWRSAQQGLGVARVGDAIGAKHPDFSHSKRVYRSGNLLMSLIFPQVFSHYYRQMVTGSLGEEFTVEEYLEMILEQV